jgi:hypothetical protein
MHTVPLKGTRPGVTTVAQKSTVSLDDILAALQGIATVQTDLASRLAALENGATVKTAPTASQPTAEAPQTAQRAARRQNATCEKNTAPKAPAGTLTGTVIRVRPTGYNMLLNVDGQEMWANAPAKGKHNKKLPALFKDMQPGQNVTLTLDELSRVIPGSIAIASATPAVKTPEPAVKTPSPAVKTGQRGGDPCQFCAGPTHAKEKCETVAMTCAQQQFTNETGKLASVAIMEFAAWFSAAPRQVCAKNSTGSRFVGGPSGATAPAVETAPTISKAELAHRAQIAASATDHSAEPAVAPSPVETRNVSKLSDGTFEVLLRQFPRRRTGMMMVWSADTFNGTGRNEGKGVWLTNIDETLYAKLVKFAPNDKLSITIKDGALAKAKRLDSIEKVSGVVPGVATSGRTMPPCK